MDGLIISSSRAFQDVNTLSVEASAQSEVTGITASCQFTASDGKLCALPLLLLHSIAERMLIVELRIRDESMAYPAATSVPGHLNFVLVQASKATLELVLPALSTIFCLNQSDTSCWQLCSLLQPLEAAGTPLK